jgi:putative ABC transport system ATP-binding protein
MNPLIRLRGVHKSYTFGEREVAALAGIDLDVTEGEFVALVGPSGAGKTTCLEILGALSRPTAGRYALDGQELQELDDDALADLRAKRLGFVFQAFNLMPRMSAVQNTALPLLYAGVPRAERERRAAELLERMGLGHRLEHRPAQLSGGERQRVAIARALVNDPRIILADEPTGNLDETTGLDILSVLEELHRQGRTLVVVTHSPHVANCAQRVVRIRDGRLEEDVPVRSAEGSATARSRVPRDPQPGAPRAELR